jgi:hypothetical protein
MSEYRSIFYQENDYEASGEEGFTSSKPIPYDDIPKRHWVPQTRLSNFGCSQRTNIPSSRSHSALLSSSSTQAIVYPRPLRIPHVQSHGSFTAHLYSSENNDSTFPNLPKSPDVVRNQSCSNDPSPPMISLPSLDEEEPLDLEETCAYITPLSELASPETCPRTTFSFMRSISTAA